jgi:hypothetical protein
MSSTLKIFGGVAVAVALSSSANAQSLVSERNISLAMAQTIANGAMDKCKEMGFKVDARVPAQRRDGRPISRWATKPKQRLFVKRPCD